MVDSLLSVAVGAMPEPRPHPPPLPPCSLLEATATMATCSTLQQQPTIAPKLLPQDHNQNQNQNHNHNQNQNQNHSHSHSHNHQQSKAAGGRGRGGGGDREILKCPRCSSLNTKFCYYNNYNLSQPRHFCKACKRYWTKGGSLRNVPVGGRCRKMKTMLKPSNPNEEDQPTPPVSLSSMLASGVVPNDIDPRGRQQQHSSPGFMNLLLNGGRFDPAASVVYNSQHPFQPLEQLLDRRRMTESATFFAPIEGQFRDSDCGELRDEMGNNPYSLSGYHCHLQSPSPTPSIICDPMVGTAMTKPANTVAIDWHQGESSLLCGDLSTPLDNYWTGLSHFSLGQGPFP